MTSFLALRALMAVLLMAGFYVLAISMVAGLLYIPYAEWVYADRLHLKLAIGCLVGAGTIAWAMLPRADSFAAPGPQLTKVDNPDLFRVLEEVATQTGQSIPAEVYLVPQINAWVANRGGVMGFGGRRVMGVGLPLLQVVSISEFKAILAHEFGHFHGGDTTLGPWIYKTRGAIGRTLSELGEEGWLHLPFRWYGVLFLRITQGISRAQEYAADRLAATVIGAEELIGGLKKVHATAQAFGAYWEQEFLAVLNAGFQAPLGDGFVRFLKAGRVGKAMESTLADALECAREDPGDTHPSLLARIKAVEGIRRDSASRIDVREESAVGLLGNAVACETALIGFLFGDGAERLPSVAWDKVTDNVFVPRWREQACGVSALLAGTTLAELPELLSSRGQELARAFAGRDSEVPAQHVPGVLAGPLGACLVSTLMDAGWKVSADLGEPVCARFLDLEIEPFQVVRKLYEERAGRQWWAALVERCEIEAVSLAPTRGPSGASPRLAGYQASPTD